MKNKILILTASVFALLVVFAILAQCTYAPNVTPAAAAPLAQTNCYSFTSRDTPKSIPDAEITGTYSFIPIAVPGYVTTFTLSTTISHTWPGDLTIELCKPAGGCRVVDQELTAYGGEYTIRFSDDVTETLPYAYAYPPAYPDVYAPQYPFRVMGYRAAGMWSLGVRDNNEDDTGSLVSWGMSFCTTTPGATATATATPYKSPTPGWAATPYVAMLYGAPMATPLPRGEVCAAYAALEAGSSYSWEIPEPDSNEDNAEAYFFFCNDDPCHRTGGACSKQVKFSYTLETECDNCNEAMYHTGTGIEVHATGVPAYDCGHPLGGSWPDGIPDSGPADLSVSVPAIGDWRYIAPGTPGPNEAWISNQWPDEHCGGSTTNVHFSYTWTETQWETPTPVPTPTLIVPCPTARPWGGWWMW